MTALPDFEEYIAWRTSVARYPHWYRDALTGDEWVTCDFPERPIDWWARSDATCRSCLVAEMANAAQRPGEVIELELAEGTAVVPLAVVYEWAREYHNLPVLPQKVAS